MTRLQPMVTRHWPRDRRSVAATTDAFSLTAETFDRWGADPWNLHPTHQFRTELVASCKRHVADLLVPDQGVTVGGEGVLALVRVTTAQKANLALEDTVWSKGVRGVDIERWRVNWRDCWFLYPYDRLGSRVFESGTSGRVVDGLDFDVLLDPTEERTLKAHGTSRAGLDKIIDHRVAVGVLHHQAAARYLAHHYPELSERMFKGRNIRSFNRRWYEYIWPRNAPAMLQQPKIIVPRLVRTAEFAVDEVGYLPQDSTIALTVAMGGARLARFQALGASLFGPDDGRQARKVLLYLLGLLNSPVSIFMITAGRLRTPKGSYTVNEQLLAELPIPVLPPAQAEAVVAAVEELIAGPSETERRAAEAGIGELLYDALGLDAGQRKLLNDWAAKTDAAAGTGGPASDEQAELDFSDDPAPDDDDSAGTI